MNAFRHLKNFVENLESRYETWWWTRHYPNLKEELAETKQDYAAGRYVSFEELKARLAKEEYATKGGDADAVPNKVFGSGRTRTRTI